MNEFTLKAGENLPMHFYGESMTTQRPVLRIASILGWLMAAMGILLSLTQ